MVWKQPQLTEPPMVSAEIGKLNRRLVLAYSKNSDAVTLGVRLHDVFDAATDKALRNIQTHLHGTFVLALGRTFVNTKPGELTYDTKVALGVIVLAPKASTKRFVQQGVGFSTDAFLMGDATHSYNDALAEGTAETLRLALPMVGVPKVLIGYSMGDDVMNHVLLQWPADRRDEIKLAVGFGCPSRPPGPTLLGNNPPGQGISGVFTPEWARDRTYQFINDDGDMYPEAIGLLPALYSILVRLEASTDFALYLFQVLLSSVGPPLLGTVTSALPGAGALSDILGLITPGAVTNTTGPPNLLAMITNIPAIIQTLIAALKFISTNAHYHYHDQPKPYWRNLTAVDCAAQIITEKVQTATVFTIPGTVAYWNDGPPAWTAWKLP